LRIGEVQCHGSVLFLIAVRDLCDYATELLSGRLQVRFNLCKRMLLLEWCGWGSVRCKHLEPREDACGGWGKSYRPALRIIRLEGELLNAFKSSSPTFFEKVVLNSLVAMGYGGSIEDAASTTKRTGDDGIDGV
jgi:hypothetical protein